MRHSRPSETAFELHMLSDRDYERLIGLASLICHERGDAADAVQNALERAWRSRREVRLRSATRAWLDRIVVREAIRLNDRRQSWRHRFVRGPKEIEIETDRGPDAADLAALRVAFGQLPSMHRAVIGLHYYIGYSVSEVAEILGVPLETVRTRLRTARQRLKNELETRADM